MTVDALAVANYFIERGIQERISVTPMKLVKLVYLAHGWHLGLKGEPLIDERVQAWQYGPVIGSIYREFKGYGAKPITRKGVFYSSGSAKFFEPNLTRTHPAIPLLNGVWTTYRDYTGGQLSTLTHMQGTPWTEVWHKQGGRARRGAEIPDQLIQEHFQRLARG